MMKVIQFIPEILHLLRKVSYQNNSRLESLAHLSQRIQNQKVFSFLNQATQNVTNFSIKGTLIYLSKAFGEGLKQNFLGPNVDTGFAVLTVRVYTVALVKVITHSTILNSIKIFIK